MYTIALMSKKCNNAAIIFITPTNRIIMVRDSKNKQWMLPGGERNRGETDFECALREFHEETSCKINTKYITNNNSVIILHRNGSTTRIFIINSTQKFPKYDMTKVHNGETDNLHYISLNSLKKLVIHKIPNRVVITLKNYVQKSLNNIILQGLL